MTMTAISTKQFFDGNASATTFSFSFKVRNADHIEVWLKNTSDVWDSAALVKDTDYTVALNNDGTGTVTYPITGDALAVGEDLLIRMAAPYDQLTDLTNQGPYNPETLERDTFDQLARQTQQLDERAGRSLRQPLHEATLDMTVPNVAARAGKYQGYGATGLPVVLGGTGTAVTLGDLSASTGSGLIGHINGGTGAVARTVQGRLRDIISIKDFGAVGDGSDEGPAIQLWLDELVANGGIGILSAGTYATEQELFLRGATDVLILGPGVLKARAALWGATNRTWRILYIIDCERITLSDITFEGDGSTKPVSQVNSQRFVTIGSNTATKDIVLDRCKFRYAATQPVVVESVERSGNADDDPITSPSTVTTTGVKLLGCIFEDSLGGVLTFNGGCDDLQIINPTFRNISDNCVKFDGEIRVGGSSVNPNSCPPSRGNTVRGATIIDSDGSELASGGFFTAEERVNGVVFDDLTFTGCAAPSATASYFKVSPGQGAFEVDSAVIRNVLIEGSTYYSVVRIMGAGASEIKSVTLQNFVLKSNTQSGNVALVNLENANCDFVSLDNFEVHDQIYRLINGAPATAGRATVKNSWTNDVTDTIINLTGPGNLTLLNNDFSYAKVIVEGSSAWYGDIVVRYNTFNSTAGTGTVADLEFDNNASGTGSSWDISHNTFQGTPNVGQEKINITGTAVTGSDAVNISHNELGACVEGIRSVSTGICSHNTAASISGTKFIDFVSSATGRGGGNIMAFVHSLAAPTTNFTDFAPLDSVQTLVGAGAVDLLSKITLVETDGVNALTLADGYEGQTKEIYMTVDVDVGTLTPANLSNGATITFDDVGDSANLRFIGGSWNMIGGTATLA